jgi:rod shape-determining protein MreB
MDIAIDLGSDRTRVFIENKGKVLDEASVITYDIDTNEIYAVGNEAYHMIGKTPVGVKAVHPLDSGVIAQSELVEDMVSILLKEVCTVKVVMPKVVTAIPCELTEVEKRAVVNAVSAFGARKVYLIESPKAAALGCGIDITSPHGVMIADIGSGTADIAVLSLGDTAVSKSVKHAGSAMDEEIVKYIRKKYNLIIGTNMAENCKKAVGCVRIPLEQSTFKVKGRDAVSGLPRFVEVGHSEIKEAIEEIATEIVTAIKDVLEKTPPELIGDIYSDGIILTGGLAKLTGLAKMISEATKLKVRVHKQASDCVIMGCGKAIKYIGEADNLKTGGISPLVEAF